MAPDPAHMKSAVDALPAVVRTLLINGYVIDSFDQPSGDVWILNIRKTDALGAESRAILLFADDISSALAQRVEAEAKRSGAVTINVTIRADTKADGPRSFTLTDFFNVLGGEVRVDRIFRSDLESALDDLGHNRLPDGFAGAPDDLLEDYSKECLQFLLECPVRRYGQERRFEKRPDGLALGREGLNLFYDAKAYSDIFHPDADDVRRFTSYVTDFNRAYAAYVGRITVFLVISGSFSKDEHAIREKSNDLFAACQTPLAMISAKNLAHMVGLCRAAGTARAAVDWNRVFVPGLVDPERLRSELSKIKKDNIVAA